MKLISAAFKKGSAKVKVEVADDLWTLSQVISSGDRIKSRTIRKIKLDSETKAQVIKKPVTLTIEVEKVDWSSSSAQLRVSGPVAEGHDDIPKGSYHTITIELHSELVIEKNAWPGYQIKRVEDACKDSKTKTLVCVFDREEAYFALLKKYGYELLVHLKGEVQKKRVTVSVAQNFYKQIGDKIEEYAKRFELSYVIVASPSFWKEELLKSWSPPDELKKKIILATSSSADEGAINEVLRRPETKNALESERIAHEAKMIDLLFEKIAKGSNIAYGFDHVKRAISAGAVATLLVTDSYMTTRKESQSMIELEHIMHDADRMKAEIHIISGSHAGGERLDGLGGIAAFLRFAIE